MEYYEQRATKITSFYLNTTWLKKMSLLAMFKRTYLVD